MMRYFGLVFIYFFPMALQAYDFSAIAMAAEKQKFQEAKAYMQFAEEAKSHESEMISGYKNQDFNKTMTLIKDVDVLKKLNDPKVIIFISFSMPTQSIVSLLQDAQKIHASVVIRGLIHNEFKETFKRISSIVTEAKGGGVELNPLVFSKFNIQKIPAFVVIPDGEICLLEKICPDERFDVVYGDIPLFDALKEIRDHGTVSKEVLEHFILSLENAIHA